MQECVCEFFGGDFPSRDREEFFGVGKKSPSSIERQVRKSSADIKLFLFPFTEKLAHMGVQKLGKSVQILF